MSIDEIKSKITELSEQHKKSDNELEDIKDTDWLEGEAFDLISDYCEKMNYSVNGFPQDKKLDLDDDEEFSGEYWMLYVDKLTLSHSDVADLHWHWVRSFWPEQYENREEFLTSIKDRMSGGFYDVEL